MGGGYEHFVARLTNFLCFFAGTYMVSGSFLAAITLSALSTALAVIGYGWPVIQATGVFLLTIGVLRQFGGVSF